MHFHYFDPMIYKWIDIFPHRGYNLTEIWNGFHILVSSGEIRMDRNPQFAAEETAVVLHQSVERVPQTVFKHAARKVQQ
jgi:hypothetical protein